MPAPPAAPDAYRPPSPVCLGRTAPARLRFQRDLDRLLRRCGVAPAPPRPRRGFWVSLDAGRLSNRIRRVQEYVEVHVGEVRALDDLAEVAGLSRYHFARRFRREVGEAPWAYVRRLRDEQALRRLEAGAPPAEVAYETGFSDQSHLTRALQERYGRTPGAIRRAGRAAGPATEPGDDDGADRKDVQDGRGGAG